MAAAKAVALRGGTRRVAMRVRDVSSALIRAGALLAVALVVAACASAPAFVNTWRDPAYAGAPLRKLLVVSESAEAGIRRTTEDEIAFQLRQAEVGAVQSYTLAARDGPHAAAELTAWAAEAGADGVLVVRLIRSERRQDLWYPPYVTFAPGIGYGHGNWGMNSSIGLWYPYPSVSEYDIVTLETNVWSVAPYGLVWSGTTQSVAPRTVREGAEALARAVIASLRAEALL